jgi:sialidase-1
MKYQIVYKNEKVYSTFPCVVYLPENDQVIVAFRQAGSFSVASAARMTPTHHDNDSRCCIISSYDGGMTFDQDSFQIVTEIEFGVNDPGISLLTSGQLILRNTVVEVKPSSKRSELTTQLVAHRPDLKTVSAIGGLVIQFSNDQGKSWSSVKWIEFENCQDNYYVSREPIIELEDGTLLLSVYKSLPNKTDNAYLIRSWDLGKTWKDLSLIASDEKGALSLFQGISFNETAILNIGTGRIMSVIRADSSYHTDDNYMAIGGIGELHASFSDNAGFSWTIPKPTGIWGQPGHLIKLVDGRILCTYGFRKHPYSVKAVLSIDNGETWDIENTIIIKENAPFWDMGYPSSCQKKDGNIVTVYYWVDENNVRYIESAIWEVPVKND